MLSSVQRQRTTAKGAQRDPPRRTTRPSELVLQLKHLAPTEDKTSLGEMELDALQSEASPGAISAFSRLPEGRPAESSPGANSTDLEQKHTFLPPPPIYA